MQELLEAGIQIVKFAGAGGRAITLKCLKKEKRSVAIGSEASAIAVKVDSEAFELTRKYFVYMWD